MQYNLLIFNITNISLRYNCENYYKRIDKFMNCNNLNYFYEFILTILLHTERKDTFALKVFLLFLRKQKNISFLVFVRFPKLVNCVIQH